VRSQAEGEAVAVGKGVALAERLANATLVEVVLVATRPRQITARMPLSTTARVVWPMCICWSLKQVVPPLIISAWLSSDAQ